VNCSNLGSYCSFQIASHFTIRNGRYFLSRNIYQTANLSAANRIKQDWRWICPNIMSMICIWKVAVFQHQRNKTRWDINYAKGKIKFQLARKIKLCKLNSYVVEKVICYFNISTQDHKTSTKGLFCNLATLILTLGLQRDRRRFEKQPSQTIVNGAYAPNSVAALVLYCTPLIVPFSSMRVVTVPCSNLTLKKTLQENRIVRKHY
jgi:hypothetical protein